MGYLYPMRKTNLPDDLQSLLKRIGERLAATGKSERGAAEEAGLSGSTIRNIREGKVASPRLDTLRRLAAVLDTRVEWLAFGSEDQEGARRSAFTASTLPLSGRPHPQSLLPPSAARLRQVPSDPVTTSRKGRLLSRPCLAMRTTLMPASRFLGWSAIR